MKTQSNSTDSSQDLLKKIECLAKKLTPITEIGVLLELNEVELRDGINTIGHPFRIAYFKGMAQTAMKIRERNMALAEAGSPAADEALASYLRKMMNDL